MAETAPRVLVVDDEGFFREAIRDTLADAGIDSDVASTAEEALWAARDPRVGVVVLDVALGDHSGMEVLRKLRADRPSLRVIVLSAHADQELVLEALRLDASDYLAKPLHDEELVLAVRRALVSFDVESSWQRLRERLRRLDARVAELDARMARFDDPEAFERFCEAAAAATADVLDAAKTSLMLFDPEKNELRVAAATGTALAAAEMDPVALGEGVAGVALSLGEAVIVDDVYTDDRFAHREVRDRYESGSLAVAPLRSGEHMLGVLCATDRVGGVPFGEDELSLLKLLAIPVTHVLAAAGRAREAPPSAAEAEGPGRAGAAAPPEAGPPELAHDADEEDVELAREICEALTREIEPRRIFAGALGPVARRLGAETEGLFLLDNATGDLVLEAQMADIGPTDRERLPRLAGLTATVLQTGGLVATDWPDRDPRFDADVDTAADGRVRPLLCVPLRLRGKVLGVVRAFPEAGLGASARTGEVLSAALSAAVRNALLYRSLLDTIDELAEARRAAESRR